MKTPYLSLKNLTISRGGANLLNGLSLDIPKGEIHMIMGPNGSGKSTLLTTIMGNPQCHIQGGSIYFMGKKITTLSPSARARLGLFMTFQNPTTLMGVPFAHVVQAARETSPSRFPKEEQHLAPTALAIAMRSAMESVGLDKSCTYKALNEGFSGGEKKKAELVQLALLKPTLALIDEIDSGLDIDALRSACALLSTLHASGMTLLIVTHNPKIAEYIHPDAVHILMDGHIVRSGAASLAATIEAKGYESFAS